MHTCGTGLAAGLRAGGRARAMLTIVNCVHCASCQVLADTVTARHCTPYPLQQASCSVPVMGTLHTSGSTGMSSKPPAPSACHLLRHGDGQVAHVRVDLQPEVRAGRAAGHGDGAWPVARLGHGVQDDPGAVAHRLDEATVHVGPAVLQSQAGDGAAGEGVCVGGAVALRVGKVWGEVGCRWSRWGLCTGLCVGVPWAAGRWCAASDSVSVHLSSAVPTQAR